MVSITDHQKYHIMRGKETYTFTAPRYQLAIQNGNSKNQAERNENLSVIRIE